MFVGVRNTKNCCSTKIKRQQQLLFLVLWQLHWKQIVYDKYNNNNNYNDSDNNKTKEEKYRPLQGHNITQRNIQQQLQQLQQQQRNHSIILSLHD